MRVHTIEAKTDVFKEKLDKFIAETNYNPEGIKQIQLVTYMKVESIIERDGHTTKSETPYCLATILY